ATDAPKLNDPEPDRTDARVLLGDATYDGWCSPFLITPNSRSPNGYALLCSIFRMRPEVQSPMTWSRCSGLPRATARENGCAAGRLDIGEGPKRRPAGPE